MAQMGSRETEERARSQPSVVAQAGATRPFPRFSGDQCTRENRKVACRRRKGDDFLTPNLQYFTNVGMKDN